MSYSKTLWFETITCYKCAIEFGVPQYFNEKRREDCEVFYCPNGHRQAYITSSLSKLKKELAETHRELDRARVETREQRSKVAKIGRSYAKVRERVKNGVCPCCTRTFENLARHMKSKHPEFGDNKQLRTLRLAYGMTQAQLAEEIHTSPAYISHYERGTELPRSGRSVIEAWLVEQTA